ncbi:histidine phosphatase superfamily [Radiomyces spectabilis]|uniref:histidine phosphatase superfamily n=1 Tax=Radiomyces spectabilis TaxID=64574 RepID=UPI00221FAD66|nr:histidine phosphatase superfamily [Radiomyces spectabilis]KAI8388708.1 histidine phosphatase superfamily [Radiomyces spectabilis]
MGCHGCLWKNTISGISNESRKVFFSSVVYNKFPKANEDYIESVLSFVFRMQLRNAIIAIVAALMPSFEAYEFDVDWVAQHLAARSPYPTKHIASKDILPEGYTLEQMQLIVRHGTRYPEKDDVEEIEAALQLLRTSSNRTAVGWVDDYVNPFDMEHEGLLDSKGVEEQYLHGRRIAESYPTFISQIADDRFTGVSVFSSYTQRTAESGGALCRGIFDTYSSANTADDESSLKMVITSKSNDTMLAFHEHCPRWKNEVQNNPSSNIQVSRWKTKALAPIAERLSEDLGVSVGTKAVKNIHNGCAYEVAQRNNASTFCTLFSPEELLKLEYRNDLKYYYKYSYGFEELNGRMACNLAKKLMQDMDDAVQRKPNHERLTIKVGHSETIIPLQTFFGLFRDDERLEADSSPEVIDQRQFRTSQFGSFASNLAFQVLSQQNTDEKYIRVLVSETPVVVPGCDTELCPYSQFRQSIEPNLQCDFDTLCEVTS